MQLFAPPPPKRAKAEAATATEPPTAAATQQQQQEQTLGGFSALGVPDWLVATCREMGIRRPTPVQRACIPALLRPPQPQPPHPRDVVAEAPTGSGKTLAFALPALAAVARDPYGVFCAALAPTRELAAQVAEQFAALGAPRAVRVLLLTGGAAFARQTAELARRPHVVVATPGRIEAALRAPGGADAFARLRMLVLDEADRLPLPLRGRLGAVVAAARAQQQQPCRVALFTATAAPLLARLGPNVPAHLRLPVGADPFVFAASQEEAAEKKTSSTTKKKATLALVAECEQKYVFTPEAEKECQLVYALRGLQERSETAQAMVFAGSCRGAELLHQMLVTLRLHSVSLHSQIAQDQRNAALDAFRSGVARVLVATDVASRGLDIPAVRLVVNFDPPSCAEDYAHRVGRTARAGRTGTALTLVTPADVPALHRVEAGIGRRLDEHSPPVDDVLFHLSETSSAHEIAEMYLEETHFGESRDLYASMAAERRSKKVKKKNIQ